MAADRQRSFQGMVGERIRIARQEMDLTQEELSSKLGFKDRQILSNIESGRRKVSSEELLSLIKVLGKDLEFFTDSLRLVGEGEFCWRATAEASLLDGFERKAQAWIAMYRAIGDSLGEARSPLVPQLKLSSRSTFEEAAELAEQLSAEWGLGAIPAKTLLKVAEERLAILVLFIDAPSSISGAACHLKEFDTILVNRNDPDGRKNFDFAHELFHLLSWQVLPPDRLDDPKPSSTTGKRREQLANSFASSLLMPRTTVEKLWEGRGSKDIHEWMNESAAVLEVTAQALYFRLKNLKMIPAKEALEIRIDRLTWNGNVPGERNLPRLFSLPFVTRVQQGLEQGYLSLRRTAKELGTTPEGVGDLIQSYGLESPYEF